VSLLGLGITQSARANFINNGGFETGNFTGWTQNRNTLDNGVDTSNPHSGTYGAFSGPVGSIGYITQSLTTTAGSLYNLNFWLQNEAGTLPNHFEVSWNGNVIYSLTNVQGFVYTQRTFTGLLATGSSTVLQFGFVQNNSYWDFDDVSVEASGAGVPDAGSTLPLLGCALLGVAVLRRELRC